MASAAALHFPRAEVMMEYLSKHPLLNEGYLQEKGFTATIARLSAKRFADKDQKMRAIKTSVMMMVCDLENGEDGFTGEKLPKLDLPSSVVAVLAKSIEEALVDCANKQNK